MNNTEKFLETYNYIDEYLKNTNNENFENFASKIKNSKNAIIKNSRDKLLKYGELRNAIIHNPKIGNKYIAEPLLEVVNDFDEILQKLKNPTKVIPLFQFEVIGAKYNEKLDTILKIMREKSFSQFPIFNDDRIVEELINTISRWLVKNKNDNEIIVENPKISDLIKEIEFVENYKFIPRDCDIYTAYDYFIQQIERHDRNLDVLFITQNGKKTEKLLGLITIEDITKHIRTH